MNIETIGLIAAVLTTVSYAPQAVLVLKTKNTSGISRMMYSLLVTGVGLWIVYGFLIASWPLFFANVVTFILSSSILIMTIMNASETDK